MLSPAHLSESRALQFAALLLSLFAAPALAQKRTALLVGANTGWAVDRPLRHAGDDAHRLATTLVELGEFAAADVTVLEDPTAEELRKKLGEAAAQARSDKGLFVFYYSGHADEKYLHLRGAPVTFDELYRRLRDFPSDLKLGVLDACRAGSILAAKGGKPVQPFAVKLQDDLQVKGLAWVTSSGADELSQETRALQGSFFTHHLVSALRGAADENRDGRVSLTEAYAYASSRTTIDTTPTPTGPQRPGFRYELNGRGEIFLTRLQGRAGMLVFPAKGRRCWVTDAAQRQLFAEIAPGAPKESTLALRADDYVLKCLATDEYAVAALTLDPGKRVEVARLSFRPLALAEGVLKGGAGTPTEDALSALKRRGFQQLESGLADEALLTFNDVLNRDLRDMDGYRGKAQALLALSTRAAEQGQRGEAERLMAVAVRTDPRLEGDPSLPKLPETKHVARTQAQINQGNLEGNYPRRYQNFGIGLGFTDAHGFFNLTLDWMPLRMLQATVHLSPLILGAGASVRWVPLDRAWSPYAGGGVNGTLAGLGLASGPESALTINNAVITYRNTFDFVLYVEGGVTFATRHIQADVGLAVGRIKPVDGPVGVAVFPVLALKYFL